MEEWKVPEKLYSINIKVLELTLTTADARQKDLDTNTNNISSRVQNLLSVFVSFVVAAMGFFLANKSDLAIAIATAVTFLYSIATCGYLLKKAYTGKYIPIGTAPSYILTHALSLSESEDHAIRSVYVSLLNDADERIKANRAENSRRLRIVKNAIQAAFYLPIVLIFVYFIAAFLNHRAFFEPFLRLVHSFFG